MGKTEELMLSRKIDMLNLLGRPIIQRFGELFRVLYHGRSSDKGSRNSDF
jgi:hypothetical protein